MVDSKWFDVSLVAPILVALQRFRGETPWLRVERIEVGWRYWQRMVPAPGYEPGSGGTMKMHGVPTVVVDDIEHGFRFLVEYVPPEFRSDGFSDRNPPAGDTSGVERNDETPNH